MSSYRRTVFRSQIDEQMIIFKSESYVVQIEFYRKPFYSFSYIELSATF